MSVIASYGSRLSGATSGLRSESELVKNCLLPMVPGLLAFALVLCLGPGISRGAESNAPPTSPSQIEATNLQQVLQACSQILERLQAAQLAIEQNRQATEETALQSAMALSNGMNVLQAAFSAQRALDLEAMQKSNQLTLIVASAFGALGLLVMLVIAYFQWRTSNSLAGVSAALPAIAGMGGSPPAGALDPAGQANLRLLGAVDQLDKRSRALRRAVSPGGKRSPAWGLRRRPAAGVWETSGASETPRILSLLDQAQSLMNSDNAEGALACCEEVLSLDPNHAATLVKRGAALERLHRFNEALECYDRAISVDGSMTLAYLHKGGLCNRLERFKEALECYGRALLAHDQRGR
jgi:tetratricopeptide (TPR) repeat protein